MEQIQQPRCTVCQLQNLLPSLSFGKVPSSNRFLAAGTSNLPPEDYYSMSLGYCKQCGTIQVVDRIPTEPLTAIAEVSAAVLDGFLRKGLRASREKWREELETCHAKREKVAVFGAGHLAVKFINFYNLADLIDCVIDDHPKKVNMIMRGSNLKVVPSEELLSRGIRICISTLNPETEINVRRKLISFFDAGGRFVPAFTIV